MIAQDVWVYFIQLMFPVFKSISIELPIYQITVSCFVLKVVPRARNVFTFGPAKLYISDFPAFQNPLQGELWFRCRYQSGSKHHNTRLFLLSRTSFYDFMS